jgi:carboxylesterase type B
MLHRQSLGLISFLSVLGSAWTKAVTTTNGTVVGGKCESYDVDYFLAIPYAKAPVGDLRFVAPEPYGKYAGGELNATSPAPRCIQFGNIFVESGAASEDWWV